MLNQPPQQTGTLGPQKCHGVDEFPGHRDVRGSEQMKESLPCVSFDGQTLEEGSEPVERLTSYGSTVLHYKITWVDRCEGPPQDIVQPSADENGAWSDFLLQADWKDSESVPTYWEVFS